MAWDVLIPLSVLYALAYSAVFATLVVVALLFARDVMVSDYPPAIRERYGPQSDRGRFVGRVLGAVLGLLLVGVPLVGMLDLNTRTGSAPGFAEGFVFGAVMFTVLHIVDLVVLDWWLFCTVRPRLFALPGTEGMPEYGDKMFHLKVLVPRPVPWPLLMVPGYGVVVGSVTALVSALA